MPLASSSPKKDKRRHRTPGLIDDVIAVPPPIVSSNLVLWLDAGSSASYPGTGTTWTDISPSAFSCTLVNGPTYNAGNGGYLNFNGMDTYGSVPANAAFEFGTGDFTVEAWLWVNTLALDSYQIIAGTAVAGWGGGWYNYAANVSYGGEEVFGRAGEAYGGHGTIPVGVWLHVACSRISGEINFYRDAVVGPVITAFTESITGLTPLIVGALSNYGAPPAPAEDGAYTLNGRIAQLRIYKGKGLTQAEVTNNFNAHNYRYI